VTRTSQMLRFGTSVRRGGGVAGTVKLCRSPLLMERICAPWMVGAGMVAQEWAPCLGGTRALAERARMPMVAVRRVVSVVSRLVRRGIQGTMRFGL
jgi:hypothetical protein